MLNDEIHLLHDNSPVILAVVAKEVKICRFKKLDTLPYSSALALSYYYLFSKLKYDLHGKRFVDDQDVQCAVTEHFEENSLDYFFKYIVDH